MWCEYDYNIYTLSRQEAELVTEGQEYPYWCYGSQSMVFTHAPLSQTRRVSVDMAQRELRWMLSGSGATQDDRCAKITEDVARMWSPWAEDKLGPMYGVQWRYGGPDGRYDALRDVVQRLSSCPTTKRAVMTAWCGPEVASMRIPPCPVTWVFNVVGGCVNLDIFARSTDVVCGMPYDTLEGWMLIHLMVNTLRSSGHDVKPGKLRFTTANAHVYCQNLDVWWEMLQPVRVGREVEFIPSDKGVFDFEGKGFKVINYKAPIYSAKVVVV